MFWDGTPDTTISFLDERIPSLLPIGIGTINERIGSMMAHCTPTYLAGGNLHSLDSLATNIDAD